MRDIGVKRFLKIYAISCAWFVVLWILVATICLAIKGDMSDWPKSMLVLLVTPAMGLLQMPFIYDLVGDSIL